MTFALDRHSLIEILSQGEAKVGGAMLPASEGLWGMPPEMLSTLPGYGPDVEHNRALARKIMERLGYGPGHRLAIKVATRNIAVYRDPAVLLIDQFKQIYIDGELDPVETANWYPKITRKDYMVALNSTGSAVDDPDQQFYENYACGSTRNYSGYCNPELEKELDRQSMEPDPEKRKQLVWEIDRKLQEDIARPIISHNRAATCWQPHVMGLTTMVNSMYNGWRLEDVWLNH
jgi:peptide/nickel transport system substrate-binding protein